MQALRFHALGYLHGHTVGGTNPSLVEALGAGNPVIAHDNAYNRWVAQDAGLYFSYGRRRRRADQRAADDRAGPTASVRPLGPGTPRNSPGSTSPASTKNF